MIRAVFYILVAIFLISVLRLIIGTVMRGFNDMLKADNQARQTPKPQGTVSGHLKKDPVCGTFVPAEGSMTKKVGSEVFYFCSATCRDKYSG